jgi:hypothetical protein
MACILSKGIKLDCSNNTGGVEAIWITAVDDIATLTVNEVDGAPASGDGTVTALTMDATKSFLKFETLRNSISFEQPSSINLENGSTFYTHTIQFQIPKQDVTKRNKIYQLAAGQQKVLVIVKDMNGQYWLSGVQSDGSTAVSLQVSVANAMTGKSKGDMNGYDVTLTAELNSLAFSVSSAIATGVIADGDSIWA